MERGTSPKTVTVTHYGVSLQLHRINRGKRVVWSVAHYADGRRQLKQFSSEGDALEWLKKRAKEISKGKPIETVLRDGEGALYRRAVQLLDGLGVDLDRAIHEYVAAKKVLPDDSLEMAA